MRLRRFIPSIWLGLLAAAGACHGNDGFSREDAFEYTGLASIRSHFPWRDGGTGKEFDPNDLFGATLSTQEDGGHYVFSDVPDFDHVDWVEFETRRRVPLTGYRVGLVREGFLSPFRQVARVRLLADTNASGTYVLLDSFVPHYPPEWFGPSDETRMLTNLVVASRFRLEFEREGALRVGTRVVEVDAITAVNASNPELVFVVPEPDEEFVEGTPITVRLEAFDTDEIEKVELYVDEELIGSHPSDFQFVYNQAQPGERILRARAYDRLGGETEITRRILVREIPSRITFSPPRVGAGYYHFDLTGGRTGRVQVIETSQDLVLWTPVGTNAYPGEKWTFSRPLGPVRQFFRVVEPPPAP